MLLPSIQSPNKFAHGICERLRLNGFQTAGPQLGDVLKLQGIPLDDSHRPFLKYPIVCR